MKPGRIWVVCCLTGIGLGLVTGWLISLSIPLCDGLCANVWPSPEYRRFRAVSALTFVGLVGGVFAAGVLHLRSYLLHVRSMSTAP